MLWCLTLNIPSLARQRCLPSWGPRRTPWFFCNFSTVWCGRLLKLFFGGGFWNYNSVIQALLASNILCLFISTEDSLKTSSRSLKSHSSSIWTMASFEHCRQAIFQIYNVQNLKITRITTFRICNVVYQAGSRWDPRGVFYFFKEHLLSLIILSWSGTHTKIRSKLVDIITAGLQKITLWGPQRTPLGILRVKSRLLFAARNC